MRGDGSNPVLPDAVFGALVGCVGRDGGRGELGAVDGCSCKRCGPLGAFVRMLSASSRSGVTCEGLRRGIACALTGGALSASFRNFSKIDDGFWPLPSFHSHRMVMRTNKE